MCEDQVIVVGHHCVGTPSIEHLTERLEALDENKSVPFALRSV